MTQGAAERPAVFRYRRPWLAQFQLDAIFCPEPISVVEASTKSGKTTSAMIWLNEMAMGATRPDRNYWWVAPVSQQADIAFRRMKRGLPRGLYAPHESPKRLTLVNGSVVWFKSGDNPDNLYGEDVYAAVIDEATRCRAESYAAVRSTLTATNGPSRIIGNVKGRHNWAYRLARKAERQMQTLEQSQRTMHHAKMTYRDALAAGFISQEAVEHARETMAEDDFRELFEAEAAETQGRVYKNFSFKGNVSADAEDDGESELLVGIDFNVNPLCAVLARREDNRLLVFDEIRLQNADTEDLGFELAQRYAGERAITAYPDPTGKRRQTSAGGKTDHSILRAYGYRVKAPKASPAVSDRINQSNALLCNATGERRLIVHPRCVNLIESLDGVIYQEGTSVVDKSMGIEHITDALDYIVNVEFPIVVRRVSTSRFP